MTANIFGKESADGFLIRQHGLAAPNFAGMLAEALRESGDQAGSAKWARMRKAAEALLNPEEAE